MEKILAKYNQHKSASSDINEHLETLYNLGKECSHITEMGVRWVSSTWPLVYSNPKKMISYDLYNPTRLYYNKLKIEQIGNRQQWRFFLFLLFPVGIGHALSLQGMKPLLD